MRSFMKFLSLVYVIAVVFLLLSAPVISSSLVEGDAEGNISRFIARYSWFILFYLLMNAAYLLFSRKTTEGESAS